MLLCQRLSREIGYHALPHLLMYVKKIGKPGKLLQSIRYSGYASCLSKASFWLSSCSSFAVAMFGNAIFKFVYRGDGFGYGFAYDKS